MQPLKTGYTSKGFTEQKVIQDFPYVENLYFCILGERLSMDVSATARNLQGGSHHRSSPTKRQKARKGSLVAIIKGAKYWLRKIPLPMRNAVREIAIDLSSSMQLIAKQAFPSAVIVLDRFHVHGVPAEGVFTLLYLTRGLSLGGY